MAFESQKMLEVGDWIKDGVGCAQVAAIRPNAEGTVTLVTWVNKSSAWDVNVQVVDSIVVLPLWPNGYAELPHVGLREFETEYIPDLLSEKQSGGEPGNAPDC